MGAGRGSRVAAMLLLLLATAAAAQAQVFDTGFSGTTNGSINAVVVQSDGKILIGGQFTTVNGVTRQRVAWLLASGALDPAFAEVQFSGGNNVSAIAVQGDGKVLVGGDFSTVNGVSRPSLARLNADGSLDTAFPSAFGGTVTAIVVQSDGRILVGGTFTASLIRLNADGSQDGTFAPNIDRGPVSGNLIPFRIALEPDGQIVIAGRIVAVGGVARTRLARLNADGTLDASFAPTANNDVHAIVVRPDGRIVIGGHFTSISNTTRQGLAQLQPDGTLDSTCNPGAGDNNGQIGGSFLVRTLALQADGALVVGGHIWRLAGQTVDEIGRITASCQFDSTFGPFPQALNDEVRAVALESSGHVIAGGNFGPFSGVANQNVARMYRQRLPQVSATPSPLRFVALKAGVSGAFSAKTPAQTVSVTFDVGTSAWTASADRGWVQLSRMSGPGAGTLQIDVINPGTVVDRGDGVAIESATVTISAPSAFNGSVSVPVNLVMDVTNGTLAGPPVGQVDTPAQNAAGVQGAIGVTGWVIDDVGIQHVRIYRQCLNIDNPAACQSVLGTSVVFVGEASVIAGARPDVEASFPTYPAVNTAGWGFLVLSNLLPNIPAANASGGGVGTFHFYVVATDIEGRQRLLGRSYTDLAPAPTMVTVANDTIAKPFGAIDTPGQGATVSGTLNNFGWVLTPDRNTFADGTDILMPLTGSTISVIIDGAVVGTATYDLCRGSVGNPVPSGVLCDDDVSSIFRGTGVYRNLDAARGAIALRTISSSELTNGLHTIQWGVTDSAGRSEGIGSRYFTVLNSSADACERAECEVRSAEVRSAEVRSAQAGTEVYARTGFDVRRAFVPLSVVNGVPTVRVPEMGRVELQIPGVVGGALRANGQSRDMPVGMSIDAAAGMVRWSIGPGYLGTYRLAFDIPESRTLEVEIVITPMALADEPVRMHLDAAHAAPRTPHFVLHGWALDPQADTGAGIGAVHVWGHRRSAECGVRSAAHVRGAECAPVFLGVATLGIARPDVAAAHGEQFPTAGFVFSGQVPDAGEWEITAYVWSTRTGRFEDARSLVIGSR